MDCVKFSSLGVQYQVESYQRLEKWYLIPPCSTPSIIRLVSRVKWSNPRKEVSPSPTPRCSSYWKGSFRVALDYSRQLYLTLSKCYSLDSLLQLGARPQNPGCKNYQTFLHTQAKFLETSDYCTMINRIFTSHATSVFLIVSAAV